MYVVCFVCRLVTGTEIRRVYREYRAVAGDGDGGSWTTPTAAALLGSGWSK